MKNLTDFLHNLTSNITSNIKGDMEKRFGSPKRQDGLMKVGRNKYDLFFGFGKENEEDASGWNYYHRFTHRPTLDEIKEVITAQIDNDTDMKILTQFSWNGKAVYLSKENQMNFKAAYDLAVQTNGQSLLSSSNSERMQTRTLYIIHSLNWQSFPISTQKRFPLSLRVSMKAGRLKIVSITKI